jgi:hypothetical protein
LVNPTYVELTICRFFGRLKIRFVHARSILLYVLYSEKATERWPTDVWQILKRPRAAKIGGESSDRILTARNLGVAKT